MSGPTLHLVLLVLAAIGGALIAAQGPIYARMASGVGGPLQAALLAFALGTGALFVALLATGTPLPRLADMRQVPGWVWFGGLIGVYQVLVSIHAVPRLGVAPFIVVVVAGQLVASVFYDRAGAFGLVARPVTLFQVLGLLLIVAGVVLTRWR